MQTQSRRPLTQIKILSTAITIAFLSTNVLFAHLPQTSLWDEHEKAARNTNPIQLAQLSALPVSFASSIHLPDPSWQTAIHATQDFQGLPLQYGVLRDVQVGSTGKNFLLIEDVHLNLEAQKNTIGILSELSKQNKLGTVAVEGAFGRFDFKQFKKLASPKTVKDVADAFLESNRIGAPAYVGVTSTDKNINAIGVDDVALYQQNVNAYTASHFRQESVAALLSAREKSLAAAKLSTFNPRLKKLDGAVSAYESGRLGMGNLLAAIPNDTSEIKKFSQAYRLEKTIDFSRANIERKHVLEELLPKLSRAAVDELTNMSLAYKAGQIRYSDYNRYLASLLARHAISLDRSPAFRAYMQYTAICDGINADQLLRDVQQARDTALAEATQTQAERDLLKASRALYLQKQLVSFAMTPDEWVEYQKIKKSNEFASFEMFYEAAHKRSEKIVENLLKETHDDKHGTTVLVVGGFHAPEITRLLKEKGFGYAVMSPNVTKLDDANSSAYLSVFSREKAPLEKLFAGEKLTIYPAKNNIGGPGPMSSGPAQDMRVTDAAAEQLFNDPKSIARVADKGQEFDAIDANRSNTPAGYEPIKGAVEVVAGTPMQFVRPIWNWKSALEKFRATLRSLKHPTVLSILAVAMVLVFQNPVEAVFGMAGLGAIVGILQQTVHAPEGKTWLEQNVPSMVGKIAVEATMEMSLPKAALDMLQRQLKLSDEEMAAVAMSNSTGGIGPLLQERVIAQSELGADVKGFSLLYDKVWVQKIVPNHDGSQKTHIEQHLVDVGVHLRKILINDGTIKVQMQTGATIDVTVWKSPPGMYGKGTVYFLDYPQITTVVYPGETDQPGTSEAQRLSQSWLLGRGILGKLKQLGENDELNLTEEQKISPPFVITMSEMPTIFVHNRMFEDEFTDLPFFKNSIYIFNDHTPLDYAHPKWDWGNLIRMMMVEHYYHRLSTLWANATALDGTAAAINIADGVFAVAKKHGEVMRRMPILGQFSDKIKYVTNGVSSFYWPHPLLRNWRDQSDEHLLAHKESERVKLILRLAKRTGKGEEWAQRMIEGGNPIGIWTRRLVEYKRVDRFVDIACDPIMREEFLKTGIIFVIGGRIHQDDGFGPYQYNRLQEAMAQDPRLKDFIVFFENYNIGEAPNLFHGASFSVMLANDGREASATGFQKAQMNGDLIIASNDGAVPESVVFARNGQPLGDANGFEVPYVHFPGQKEAFQPTAQGLLSGFQQFRAVYDNKPVYGQMVRNALKVTDFVSVTRTGKDMLTFLGSVVDNVMSKRNAVEAGRQTVLRYFSEHPMTPTQALQNFVGLSHMDSFTWKFKPYMAREEEIFTGNSGLVGFVEGAQRIRNIGSVGEWSIALHTSNAKGYGDIAAHLKEALKPIEGLHSIYEMVAEAAEETKAATDFDAKNKITLRIMGMMEGLLQALEQTPPTEPAPSTPHNPEPETTPPTSFSPEESSLLKNIQSLHVQTKPAKLADELANLVPLETYDVSKFGADRQNLKTFALSIPGSPARVFLSNAAAAGSRNFRVRTLESLIEKKDHVLLMPKTQTAADLEKEIIQTQRAVNTRGATKVIVYLSEENTAIEPDADFLKSHGVELIHERDLNSNADIEKALFLPTLGDGGRLKLMSHIGQPLPEFLMRGLLELGKTPAYADLMEFILVSNISAEALAVQATLHDMDALQVFQIQA